jgi:hypothetical protein
LPEDTPPKPPSGGWKDHPVVVAAIACAASLVFAQQVIFPILTASLQTELATYKTRAAEVGPLKERIAVLESQLKDAPGDLAKIQTTNMFSLGNPYPIGLSQIKLGDSIDVVTKTYPSASIERKSFYWSVTRPNSAFSAAAYLFERDSNDKRVSAIQFYLNSDAPLNLLQTKLVEAVGQPTYSGPKRDCSVWKVNDRLFVRKKAPRSFDINTTDYKCEED